MSQNPWPQQQSGPYPQQPTPPAQPTGGYPTQQGADPFAGWAPPSTPPSYQQAPRPTPQRRRPTGMRRGGQPVVTWGIIAACVLVWIAERGSPAFYQQVALTPALGYLEPWRLLTSAFAHSYQPMHIMFNMYALWALGQGLERALGRARFVALYLLSALGGSIAFIATAVLTNNWAVAVVGASGAVFGLFGALLPVQRQVGASSGQLYLVLAINFAIGFLLPGIAWQAHLGGFLTGLAAGALMVRAVNESRRGGGDRTWYYLGGLLAALLAIYGGLYLLTPLA